MIALTGISVVVFAKFWYSQHQRESWANRSKTPPPSESKAAEIPEARFTDVTAAAGIQFVHNNGAYGEKQNYGRTVLGVIRSTFVIDEKGHIERAMYNVKATGHVAKLRKDLGID